VRLSFFICPTARYHYARVSGGGEMPNILIRDVEATVLEKLKRRAADEGRSLQSEMQVILKDAAARNEPLSELKIARRIRASLKTKNQSNSAELLREDRGR